MQNRSNPPVLAGGFFPSAPNSQASMDQKSQDQSMVKRFPAIKYVTKLVKLEGSNGAKFHFENDADAQFFVEALRHHKITIVGANPMWADAMSGPEAGKVVTMDKDQWESFAKLIAPEEPKEKKEEKVQAGGDFYCTIS